MKPTQNCSAAFDTLAFMWYNTLPSDELTVGSDRFVYGSYRALDQSSQFTQARSSLRLERKHIFLSTGSGEGFLVCPFGVESNLCQNEGSDW